MFIICFNSIQAQHVIKALPRWMVNAHIQMMVPGSPLTRFHEKVSFGYLAEAQYRLQYNKPFLGGVYFAEAGLSRYSLKYFERGIEIKEKANTRRMEGGVTFGFYPEVNWLLQPYLQGRAGVALFQSSSILTDADSQELIERISESATFAPGYGLDAGIHIVPNIWYVRGNIRVGWTGNTSTTILLLDESLQMPESYPIESFRSITTAASWWNISLGLSYLF